MSDISDVESWVEDEMSIDEIEEDEDDEDSAYESDEDSEDEYDIQEGELNPILHATFIHLTKYEKTKILGIRARQIEMGAPPKIKYSKVETPLDIAERELKMKKLPFKIKRKLPTGEVETIKLGNLS
jgi:DNA-directed RNA polymerase subunit K/omega